MSPQKRSRDELKKYVFYGMLDLAKQKSKYYVRDKECFEVEGRYKAMRDIVMAAAELTPSDFLNMFPVDKEYDGEKYGIKDYFYTMRKLQKFTMDERIGEMIIPFLEIYYSNHVFFFSCEYFDCICDYSVCCGVNEPKEEYFRDV